MEEKEKVPIVEQEEQKALKRKEQEEENMQLKYKVEREFLLEKIRDPKTPHKEARRIILKSFPHDTEVYREFFLRPNLTKRVGRSFCLEIKDPSNWFLLFKNPNVKFTIPELLFWAIRADNYANVWRVFSLNYPNRLSDFSILTKALDREDVKEFFEESSIFNLIITGWRLKNKKIWDIIKAKEEYVILEEGQIFPINVISFFIKLATFIPISLLSYFFSLGVDVYLENKYTKKEKKN